MSEQPPEVPQQRTPWRRLLSPWMLLVVFAIGSLTWLGVQVHRRQAERDALAELQSVDDGRSFNIQLSNPFRADDPPQMEVLFVGGPDWMSEWLGVDMFRTITFFQVYTSGNSFSFGSDEAGMLVFDRTYRSGITDEEAPLLGAFANLTGLHLEANPVGDEIGPVLGHLPQLESLNLAHSTITDAVLPHIARLNRLKHLDLSRTNVTDAGIDHLAGLSALEHLHLSMTNVTEERAEWLRRQLPKCQIER